MRTVAEIRRGLMDGTISDNPVEITFEEACFFLQCDPEKLKDSLAKDKTSTFLGKPAVVVGVQSENLVTQ